MDAFSALSDRTRRRILELLVMGESSAGDLTAAIGHETGISQPAVSQHLAALRSAGLVTVRSEGTRRFYSTRWPTLAAVAAWVDAVTPEVAQPLDALATEVARGKRRRRPARSSATTRAS